jgi:hypothetical protein
MSGNKIGKIDYIKSDEVQGKCVGIRNHNELNDSNNDVRIVQRMQRSSRKKNTYVVMVTDRILILMPSLLDLFAL